MLKRAGFFIGWILFLGGVFYFIYLPQQHRLSMKIDGEKKIIDRMEKLSKGAEGVWDVEGEIEKNQNEIRKYEGKFPTEGDMPHVIQKLSELFSSSQLTVVSLLPKGVVSVNGGESDIVKNILSVELMGRFQDFGNMIHGLEFHTLALTVESVEIDKVEEKSNQIKIKMEMGIFIKKQRLDV
ncbi:MAG: type 4a pilus biogenesis protein PilO [Chlamydiae bacterium]|nr:type 4a pilus biogenesis protein PilO [Chlamydiota bacterium]MBI3277150.1 type 4a pilus biogenesis protein PilO [Chlamydiota bacterium]